MLGRRKRAGVESVSDSWTIAKANYGEFPLMLRVNAAYQEASDRTSYPIRIGVALPINEPNERGWPTGPEGEQLQAAEDVLLRVIAGRAVLVGVITGKNMREFVFHARGSDWIPQFHEEAVAAVTTHEVQVIAQHDPEWMTYRGLLPHQ